MGPNQDYIHTYFYIHDYMYISTPESEFDTDVIYQTFLFLNHRFEKMLFSDKFEKNVC